MTLESASETQQGLAAVEVAEVADANRVYLRRLRRMLTLRYQAARYLSADDRMLLDRGILSAYLACRSIGLEAEAIRSIEIARERARRDQQSPEPPG